MHGNAPNPGTENADLFWPAALNSWGPSTTSGAEWNSTFYESYVLLNHEWQAFVGRRTKEDLRLLQQLTSAMSPQEMWSFYARFWQKAVEDYWREYVTIAKLASGLISSGMAATQESFEQAPEVKTSLHKAA
jgi:hypothetical protein